MKLCVDPGHGMGNRTLNVYDSGAVVEGYREADITLATGLTVKYFVANAGIATWMTRYNDKENDPLARRDDNAEAQKCTHLVSIHCNSASTPSATGTETFYRDSRDRVWARKIHTAALGGYGLKDRGIKKEGGSQHARLGIFDFDGPACLVEIGFLTNKSDRSRILEDMRRVLFGQLVRDVCKSVQNDTVDVMDYLYNRDDGYEDEDEGEVV